MARWACSAWDSVACKACTAAEPAVARAAVFVSVGAFACVAAPTVFATALKTPVPAGTAVVLRTKAIADLSR